uniref:CSON014571 protein n=1 Tax=Culicoides sonorensis TaxID=179676 RepID=A0A336MEX5_CULSO
MAYSIGALNAKKPKLKKGNFKKKLRTVVSEHFNDYFINTTLHGLKYVGQTYLHIIERLFFAISFILVVCLSGYFITNVYMKWVNTPIIISLDPQLSQSKDFPFPAVTVCNMNQAKESVAKIIPKRSKEHSVLTSLCYHKKFNSTVDSTIFGTWAFVRRFIVNISQPCTELLMACKFSGEDVLCDDIFQSILTDEGLCCTFNSLDAAFMFRTYNDQNNFDIVNERKTKSSVYWSPETGVRSKNFSKSPRRNPGAGTHMGLSLMLNVDLDEYFCSSTNSYGFKAIF